MVSFDSLTFDFIIVSAGSGLETTSTQRQNPLNESADSSKQSVIAPLRNVPSEGANLQRLPNTPATSTTTFRLNDKKEGAQEATESTGQKGNVGRADMGAALEGKGRINGLQNIQTQRRGIGRKEGGEGITKEHGEIGQKKGRESVRMRANEGLGKGGAQIDNDDELDEELTRLMDTEEVEGKELANWAESLDPHNL